LALLAPGCGSDGEAPAPRASVEIGEIAWVDADNTQAVVLLESASAPGEGTLVAVDFQGRRSAVLTPAGLKRGASLGVTVTSGAPAVGDRVFIPGSGPAPLGGAGSTGD
jgi:hypothetical protein